MARRAVHGPRYRILAPLIVRAANADPNTRCWRDGLTLAEHTPHKNGRPAFWTAGHLKDGQPDATLTIHDLAAEASTDNFSQGASFGNRQRIEPRTARLWQ
jgi:hypothetical protein